MEITSTQKEFVKILKEKQFGEYLDFYVQSDTVLLAHVFENLRNTYLEIYEFDLAKLLSVLGSAWLAALRKCKVKLDLLIDINMLLMVEKSVRGGTCLFIFCKS